jgi:hypothetical protein
MISFTFNINNRNLLKRFQNFQIWLLTASLLILKTETRYFSELSQKALQDKKDVSYLNQPGVYEILDVLNNKSYYRESSYLCGRLEVHMRSLRKGNHLCKGLQESYDLTKNLDNFQFFILVSGPA